MRCCSYGPAFSLTAIGFDCAIIPSPSNVGGESLSSALNGFCGGELSTNVISMPAPAIATDAKTVCCK